MTRSGRGGFTLLEVLVATVIMGIAVTALISGLSQSVRNAGRLRDYDRASMLARAKMNDLLLDADLPFEGNEDGTFSADQSGDIPSGWKVSLRPFDVPPNAGPGTVVLQEVALDVWWEPASGGRRDLRLQSYRPRIIPIPAAPQ
ncbi:MAG TPA: prepilin-type N-terminal cleavage/methylation domain-containing protein [Bryobacteraceae bacterium]|nr:prepilin-type N-terminal cleavage/methylation domain-containing protein [Bryobacteraceae bacterium]